MTELTGIAASEGIAIGPVHVYRPDLPTVSATTVENPEEELSRYEEIVSAVNDHLQKLGAKLSQTAAAEDAEIFEVQQEFLEDPTFGGEIRKRIAEGRVNAEAAVEAVMKELVEEFESIDDEYFHQRSNDIQDVGTRLIRGLLGVTEDSLANLPEPVIILAYDLTPSDTASMKADHTLGLCTESGSATSHTAILSRSMGVPAVVGLGTVEIEDGETVILDGTGGKLIVAPDADTLEAYKRRREAFEQKRERLKEHANEPVTTSDGVTLEIVANIGSLAEAKAARSQGAEGVGLLRTEFLFLDRRTLPEEEEQYRIYREIAEVFGKDPVVIRTLDVGGDKSVPAIDLPREQNPFLGKRAIRLSLAEPEIFRTQLRAILRAGVGHNIKIMFPLIGTVGELRKAKEQLAIARKELEERGVDYDQSMEVGMMIEVPSAAVIAPQLAEEVDFFSIGTNDLTQYTLAVDRTNEHVATLADSFDPAVINLVGKVIEAGHFNGRWVGMCGEMAGNPQALPLLLGLGLDEFSMSGGAIPEAKERLRKLSKLEARKVAQKCLRCATAAEVRELLAPYAEREV